MLGSVWLLLARGEVLAKKPLALDTKCTWEGEAKDQGTLQIFTCISIPAPDNLYAAFPARLRTL